eukprot:gb/GEZN01013067.1/.p1 GENE.gb/GEZN01013067.1/~~gb/GEZN01013067.1/.p1  ORF type:complete len:291 (-),score=34.03 gb/GEZN01013067.1/:136-1008(-)
MGGSRDSNNLGRLTPLENLTLGMCSGFICKSINYPLLVFKNTTQQGLPLSFNPRIVYRGLPMACINLGGTTAVQFWFTGFFQKFFTNGDKSKLTAQIEIQSAFLAGTCSGVPNSLWELTMIQQQRFGGTLIGTPTRLVKDYGAMTLGRGVITTVGRESLFTMAMLGLCPVVQKGLMEKWGLGQNVALASGALITALFSATLTHPMDTIKTCMQGDVEQKKYNNIRGTATALINEYGIAKGLFKGFTWRAGLIATSFFLINRIKETLLPVMFPDLQEKEFQKSKQGKQLEK